MSSRKPLLLDIGFVSFELYDDYLVATVREGVVLEAKEMKKFYEVFDAHYSGRPFGYISNRKFDYTINPTYYKEVEKFDFDLVGAATLCYSGASYDMAKFAEKFFNWEHEAFYTLEESISYIKDLLKKNKKAGL